METRALAIALFYAVGTAAGGIAGPVLFGQFIHSGDADRSRIGFFIGAGAMALGGIAELFFGVRAEQQSLENIATPADRRGGRGRRRRLGPRRLRASAFASATSAGARACGGSDPARARRSTRPAWLGSGGRRPGPPQSQNTIFDREIETLSRALEDHGPMPDEELEMTVDGRCIRALPSGATTGRPRRTSSAQLTRRPRASMRATPAQSPTDPALERAVRNRLYPRGRLDRPQPKGS